MATIVGNIQSLGPSGWEGGGLQPWYYNPGAAFLNDKSYMPRPPKIPNKWDQLRNKPKPVKPARPVAGGATGGGGSATPTTPTVTSTIRPTNIYTPQMTQAAVNNAVAQNTPDFRFAMKANYTPGVSRSAGSMAAAMPSVTGDILGQRKSAAEIPLLDEIANQKHMMAGQVGRESESLAMANLLSRLNALKQRDALNNLGTSSNLLLSLLG